MGIRQNTVEILNKIDNNKQLSDTSNNKIEKPVKEPIGTSKVKKSVLQRLHEANEHANQLLHILEDKKISKQQLNYNLIRQYLTPDEIIRLQDNLMAIYRKWARKKG